MTYLEMIKFYTEQDKRNKSRIRRNVRVFKIFNEQEIRNFVGKFMRKYSDLIAGKQIRANIDDCMQLWTNKINIQEFENRTGLTLEKTTITARYQIGW